MTRRSRREALGIRTDGLALDRRERVAGLISCGLKRVQIPFHSARGDANDWLLGVSGGTRRIWRSLKTCQTMGLEVTVEIVLTRPTASHVQETVRALLLAGVRRFVIRMLRFSGPASQDFVALSPRFSLVYRELYSAILLIHRSAGYVAMEGFSLCASRKLSHLVRPPAHENFPDASKKGVFCQGCPGLEQCQGVAKDYISCFGWMELWKHQPSLPRQSVLRMHFDEKESTRSIGNQNGWSGFGST